VRESSLTARRGRGWGVFQWTVTEGLQRIDVDMGAPQRMLAEPPQLLRHLKATPMPGIYVLPGLPPVSVRSHQRPDVEGCGPGICPGGTDHRLDFGGLYSKWHGESEKNLRESLVAAEALAPCVLWIDEIEKALAAGEGDSGTSRRVLGTFLTWLSEQRSRIFVVATANDISALPPELIRKGRLDEIFFVDLPDEAARAAILAIYARKRSLQITPQEVLALAKRSAGFSGAELEQAIVAALYSARAGSQPITATAIAQELKTTKPLSVVMSEKIEALRAWAQERTVPAD
jgi:hypothetical protein